MKEYEMCGIVVSKEEFSSLEHLNKLDEVIRLTEYFQGGVIETEEGEQRFLIMVPTEFRDQLENIFPEFTVENILADENNFSPEHPYRKGLNND